VDQRLASLSIEQNDDLNRHVGVVRDELDRLENELIQTGEGKVGAELKPRLMRQLTYLYGMMTTADQRPGEDAYQRFDDIEAELARHRADLETLLNEGLSLLNAGLLELGQKPVEVLDD
jgi:hypothetical protein